MESNLRFMEIDKKLISTDYSQILEGIDALETFLAISPRMQLFNSIVMRLLNLLQNTQHFFVKIQIPKIFLAHTHIIAKLTSKEELVSVVHRCMCGTDQFTRIMCLKIILDAPKIFGREMLVYHSLLHKLPSLPKVEQFHALKALITLLQHSESLTEQFALSLTTILQVYKLRPKIVLFILRHLSIHPRLHIFVLDLILPYCKQHRLLGRQIYSRFQESNYTLIGQYTSLSSPPSLTSLRPLFIYGQYSPLSNPVNANHLLDNFFMKKRRGITIDEALFHAEECPRSSPLLFYYLPLGMMDDYNLHLKTLIQEGNINLDAKLLKQLISVGNSSLAQLVLQSMHIPNQYTQLVLEAYLQLHCGSETYGSKRASLLRLKEVCRLLCPNMTILVDMWVTMGEVLSCRQTAISEVEPQLHSLQIGLQSSQFPEEFELLYVIFAEIVTNLEKPIENNQLKRKSLKYLPASIFRTEHFWFVQLSKATTLALFQL